MIVEEQQNGDKVLVDVNRSIPGVAGRTELMRIKSSEAAGQTPSVSFAGPVSLAGAVTQESVAAVDLTVTGDLVLPNDSVTAAMLLASVSAEATATGSAQNVAHGLGAAPSMVLVVLTELAVDGSAFDVTYGTHTSTNAVVTVAPSGCKFKVLAFA